MLSPRAQLTENQDARIEFIVFTSYRRCLRCVQLDRSIALA
jgi:hypothetical protein